MTFHLNAGIDIITLHKSYTYRLYQLKQTIRVWNK